MAVTLGSSDANDLRSLGWRVAVHNDYVLNGQHMTFWLFTNSVTGRFLKGEGLRDSIALDQVRNALTAGKREK